MNVKQISRRFSSWLPSKGNVLFTLLALGAMLWAQTAGVIAGFTPATTRSATSTNTISYQGYLADSNNLPLTGSYDMVFRLYNSPTGGVALWEESWSGNNMVSVIDGLFGIGLGHFNTSLTTVIQGNSDLYLGISIDGESELNPRTQFRSAPYVIQPQLTQSDIEIGWIAGNDNISGGWNLWTGSGDRNYRIRVDFERPYSSPPSVYLALNTIDADTAGNVRLRVAAENISETGFDAVIYTWSSSLIHGAGAIWIAQGTPANQ